MQETVGYTTGQDSAIPSPHPFRRLTLLPRKWALRSRAYGAAIALEKLQRPASDDGLPLLDLCHKQNTI
jgi:hypothetical protein